MRRRVITRVTTSVRSCLAAKTSSGTANSIPFRYNRRSCHCLPVSIKRDIRIPLIAFKPGQQCLSEAIFHLRLHIPLSLGTLAQNESSHFTLLHIHKRNRFIIYMRSKKSSGDFPVVWCTHVLSSSTSFPYGKIVTHFQWFVNGEILIYGYFTFHSFGSGFHGDHCSSFCFCGDLAVGSYNCYGCFAGCISYFFLACYRSENWL